MSTKLTYKGYEIIFTKDELNTISNNWYEKDFDQLNENEVREVKHMCLVSHILSGDLDNLRGI